MPLYKKITRYITGVLFLTILLALVQALLKPQVGFLGQATPHDVEFGFVELYPFTTLASVIKIAGVFFVYATLLGFGVVFVTSRQLLLASVSIASLSFLCFSQLLNYPALFEIWIPHPLQMWVYKSADVLTPTILKMISAFFLSIQIVLVFLETRSTKFSALCLLPTIFLFEFKNPFLMAAREKKSQHIFFIGIDSFRKDHLNANNMPTLFRESQNPPFVSFDDHVVGIPRTFPSWIEILYGRYAMETGIRHMFPNFSSRSRLKNSFVEILKNQGFATRVFSDFAGDIFPRFSGGFSEIHTPTLTISYMLKSGVITGFPLFLCVALLPGFDWLFPELSENPAYADSKRLVQSFKNKSEFKSPRTFTTLFFSTAHFPFASPWPFYKKFAKPEYNGAFLFQRNPSLAERPSTMNPDDIAQIRNLYKGAIRSIDDGIKDLFEYLKANQLWDDAIIIVTGDHGEDLFESGFLGGHGDHLRGKNVIEVPLLIKLPKNMSTAKTHYTQTTRSIDLAPTILSLVGIDSPHLFSGRDLLSHIDAEPANSIQAYSETGLWFSTKGDGFFQKERLRYPGISSLLTFDSQFSGEIYLNPKYETTAISSKHRSLIEGPYKLIYTPTTEGPVFKLYNRKEDPTNIVDISAKEPQVFQKLKDDILKIILEKDSDYHLLDNYVVTRD